MMTPDAYADEIGGVYQEAELSILRRLRKRMEKNLDVSWWSSEKLGELNYFMREVADDIPDINDEEIEALVEEAYLKGQEESGAILRNAKLLDPAVNPTGAKNSIRVLVQAQHDVLAKAHVQILRASQDAYRSVIGQVSSTVLTGAQTRRQAVQEALWKLANQGISGFIDRAGRKWNIGSYCEMATRTTTHHAFIQGSLDKYSAANRDLVRVSSQGSSCPTCAPWQGSILSISGNDERYRSVQEAREAGLLHPNCSHGLSLYVPGLSKDTPTGPKFSRDQIANTYSAEQRLRNAERHIRLWKRKLQVAITPENEFLAKSKVKEWQAKAREITSTTEARRDYTRESLKLYP